MGAGHNRYFGVDQNLFNQNLDADFDPDQPAGPDRTPQVFRPLYTRPYHFWPINTALDSPPHWVTGIVQLEPPEGSGNPFEDNNVRFTVISRIVIVDPDRSFDPRVEAQTFQRLHRIYTAMGMTPSARFTATGPNNVDLWVPPSNLQEGFDESLPAEEFSGGLRCFWLIRLFLNRVLDACCYSTLYPANFFGLVPGFFNPDFVRSEMIGHAAAAVNHQMEYRTRIAIEPIRMMNIGPNRMVRISRLAPDST